MKDLLAYAATPWSAVFSLIFFLCIFLAACVWAWSPGRKKIYNHLSKLPLDQEN